MLHVFVRLANRITMISGKIFSYSNLNQQEGCLVAGLEMQHKGFHPWSVINISLATQPKKARTESAFHTWDILENILQTVWWREGRRAHYCQCLSDGVIGIVSSWMKLQSVGKISRKFLEKLKNPRLRTWRPRVSSAAGAKFRVQTLKRLAERRPSWWKSAEKPQQKHTEWTLHLQRPGLIRRRSPDVRF